MELAALVSRRPVPGAGLLVTLTRRCPLRCAHCSTASGPEARERPDPAGLRRFVGSFTPADRPDVMMLTGGEPMLLPRLVADLATAAGAVGTRTAVLSGMFFAARPRARSSAVVPPALLRALRSVDHFSASLDAHHEREVARSAVFRALREIREAGPAVSLHVTGEGPDDPYLADLIRDIDWEFDGTMPTLVNEIRAVGRAATWAGPARRGPGPDQGLPCAMAAWPVVAFDGSVLACCNQRVVDRRPAPAHLLLGHVERDGWGTVRARSLESPLLRLIRAAGPLQVRERYGTEAGQPESPCAVCVRFAEQPRVAQRARVDAGGAAGALLDVTVGRDRGARGAVALVRQYGSAAYASSVLPRGAAR
ncbi:radical SAM protein [Streptomyces sp. MUM 203J]|uniref:radical SAM protein n=1 Tax=Streptomyces sp. MUM 203J TaxID=2791990 RepID=UPI001F048D0E|nr:radical SAM protein [Streptomyces sp. MUM 203J]MCH0543392.1 radical SAM protein [Streptomyces sp. MUM 203J]